MRPMTLLALILTAWLFGGMATYSAGFAPVLFKTMPMAQARATLRGAFPHYYAAVVALSALCALAALPVDGPSAAILAGIAATTLWARQDLMARVNAATDAGDAKGFARLHGASVALQLAQLAAAAWALARIAG